MSLTRLAQESPDRWGCPRQARFVGSLPKSPIGKILRKELRGQV